MNKKSQQKREIQEKEAQQRKNRSKIFSRRNEIKSVIGEALDNVDKYIDKKEQRMNNANVTKIQKKFRQKYGDKRNSIDTSDVQTVLEGSTPLTAQR
jgi:hypothetical protein